MPIELRAQTYAEMNPVDAAMARRVFWLQFNSDMSAATIDFLPNQMHFRDSIDVGLPSQMYV